MEVAQSKRRVRTRRTRIFIVDSHPLTIKGIEQVINAEADMEVCGNASHPRDAMNLLMKTPAELVVVDVSLAGGCGLELVRQIKEKRRGVRVIVCSVQEESAIALRCLNAGAHGFVNKQQAPEILIQAIRHVMKGNYFFSPGITQQLLHQASRSGSESTEPDDSLSSRELEVFILIGQGRTTQQIANDLGIGLKTVESHRQNIKRKLGLRDAVELTYAAVRWVMEKHNQLSPSDDFGAAN